MTLAQLMALIDADPELRAARSARLSGRDGIEQALIEAARMVG